MSYKAIEISAELADELKKRLPTLILTETSDGSGNPVISLTGDATPAAGEKVIFIRTTGIDWPLAKDVLGLASPVYTPHVIQLCTELNFAGTTDNVADILTAANLLAVLGCVLSRGTRVEWYQTAVATIPSVAAMIAANMTASWESNIYHGMQASQ